MGLILETWQLFTRTQQLWRRSRVPRVSRGDGCEGARSVLVGGRRHCSVAAGELLEDTNPSLKLLNGLPNIACAVEEETYTLVVVRGSVLEGIHEAAERENRSMSGKSKCSLLVLGNTGNLVILTRVKKICFTSW